MTGSRSQKHGAERSTDSPQPRQARGSPKKWAPDAPSPLRPNQSPAKPSEVRRILREATLGSGADQLLGGRSGAIALSSAEQGDGAPLPGSQYLPRERLREERMDGASTGETGRPSQANSAQRPGSAALRAMSDAEEDAGVDVH